MLTIVWRVGVLRAKDGKDGIVRAVFLEWTGLRETLAR